MEIVLKKLLESLKREPQICENAQRCEALLKDFLRNEYKRETHALIMAVREGVVRDLKCAVKTTSIELLLPRLSLRLQTGCGLQERLASWAVSSWAFVLGMRAQPELFDVAHSQEDPFAEAFSPEPIVSPSTEELMKNELLEAMQDGEVTQEEQAHLRAVQIHLGLSAESVRKIIDELVATHPIFLLKKRAEQGDLEAHCMLGKCYADGKGVTQDLRRAVEWYQRAASHGFSDAQFSLGRCCLHGRGVEVDHREAMEWFRRAAEQGHVEAMFHLGKCYYQGLSGPADFRSSLHWFMRAADLGHAQAQYYVGRQHFSGIGVNEDYHCALEWFFKSAWQGFSEAQFLIGHCFYNGLGVAEDRSYSFFWLSKAAQQGHIEAQKLMNEGF